MESQLVVGQTTNSKRLPQAPPTTGSTSPTSPTSPTINGTIPPVQAGNKRRRTSAVGSRGVSNLTPEQLQKKRANDREAQRAIRERTKNHLERLEKTIRELQAQQTYLDLQEAVKHKNVVEAENADLKRRLASIVGLAQQPLAAPTLHRWSPPSRLLMDSLTTI